MATNIEIKSFKIDGEFENAIETFVNTVAQQFDIKGCFGPVTNPSDNCPHVFILFAKQQE